MIVRKIFQSIDGEVNYFHQGRISTFIRFAGCNFFGKGPNDDGCQYCDTVYAQSPDSGYFMSVEDIIDEVVKLGSPNVTITGGEPLLQNKEEMRTLLNLLVFGGFKISVETNGSFPILSILEGLHTPAICWIMDYKLSSSGMEDKMDLTNFLSLQEKDFIKFVVQDQEDFFRASVIRKKLKGLGCKATFAFSSVFGKIEPSQLVEWLKGSQILDAVLNVQLHKILWPNIDPSKEER